MNSSPVLLLQPTAPISMTMGSMNLTAIDTRTTMLASAVAPTMSSAKLDALMSKNTTEYGINESPSSSSMRSVAPVTPGATNVSLGTFSPGTACSPRDPSAKVATQYGTTATKVSPSANATAIVDAPLTVATTGVHAVVPTAPVAVAGLHSSVETVKSCPLHVAHAQHPLHVATLIMPPHVTPTTPSTAKRATASSSTTSTAVAAAAAPTAQVTKATSPKPVKSNTGRWTEGEHKLFLKGLEQFPYRAWKKIATLIKTRSVVQIRTHAQKYYQKMEKEEQRNRDRESQVPTQPGSGSPHSDSSAPSTPAHHSSSDPEHHLMDATSSMADDLMDDDESDEDEGVCHKTKQLASHKRKYSRDDDLFPQSSLPKRMAHEKKFMREKTMSPKQKVVTSNSKLFGHVLGDFGGGMDALSALSNHRVATSTTTPVRSVDGIKPDPLELLDEESSDTNMLLGFADVKPLDYPFSLESSLDQGLAGMDNDELLQLTDDESMDWFTSEGQEDGVESPALDDESAKSTPVSSPLNLGRYAFAPLYSQDCLQFVDPGRSNTSTTECSTPSPILTSSTDCSDFGLSADEDEDFVLDPEKFLSSYFSPDASHSYS